MAKLRLFSPANEASYYHDTALQGSFLLLMATRAKAAKKQGYHDARSALRARPQPGHLAVVGRVPQAKPPCCHSRPYRVAIR